MAQFGQDTHLDDASKAAALVTHAEKAPSPAASPARKDTNVLGPDGRLSSSGAATSLKYAKEQELPSFPTVGIDRETSGNTAAHLATVTQKPFEHWKPETSVSASQAALLASRDGGKLDLWQHKTSETGFSAAGHAMGKQRGTAPSVDPVSSDVKQKALMAASKSVSGRNRSSSNPTATRSYPDSENSTFNALNAATVANKPGTNASHESSTTAAALEAARVKNTKNVSREMYTEHPPVSAEVEEKKRQAALRASAISMAKSMYEMQQRQNEESTRSAGLIAAGKVHANQYEASSVNEDLKSQAMTYLNVQEAAQRLAAERLAKLDPDGVLAYREHYGYNPTPPKSKLSIRGRNRARSSSEGQDDSSDDEARAGRIRSQMNQFNDQIASVDAKKRAKDRENLMAAAERAVHARMHDMDEKVFSETGKVPPSLMEEWAASARAKAAAESEERMKTHGKVHIGGGKYMDQEEIDAIAAGRMQPTLDEINDTAERQRARDEEIRLDVEQRKRQAEIEKQREKEVKAELKRIKEEDKMKERQEKAAAKAAEKKRKAEEKEQREMEKRIAKEPIAEATAPGDLLGAAEKPTEEEQRELEEQIPKEPITETTAPGELLGTETTSDVEESPEADNEKLSERATSDVEQEVHGEPEGEIESEGKDSDIEPAPAAKDSSVLESEPVASAAATGEKDLADGGTTKDKSKRDSKLKGLLNKLKRSSKPPDTEPAPTRDVDAEDTGENKELYAEPSREVVADTEDKSRSPSISSVSSDEAEPVAVGKVEGKASNESFGEARDQFDDKLSAPRASYTEESPVRTSSKFQEEL